MGGKLLQMKVARRHGTQEEWQAGCDCEECVSAIRRVIQDSALHWKLSDALARMVGFRLKGNQLGATAAMLGAKVGICENTARRHIKELVALGALSKGPRVVGKYGMVPSYWLSLETLRPCRHAECRDESRQSPPHRIIVVKPFFGRHGICARCETGDVPLHYRCSDGKAYCENCVAEMITAGHAVMYRSSAHTPENPVWQVNYEHFFASDFRAMLAEDARLPLFSPKIKALLLFLISNPAASWAEAAAHIRCPRVCVRGVLENDLGFHRKGRGNTNYQPKGLRRLLGGNGDQRSSSLLANSAMARSAESTSPS